MKKKTKYNYLYVIQQYYAGAYGWEDVSEYNKSETKYSDVRKDIIEYRLTGYPTRLINRRELKELTPTVDAN